MDERELNPKLKSKLEQAGLFVSKPYPVSHSLSLGVVVGKPTNIQGNKIENFRHGYDEVDMDAPDVKLFFKDGQWIVWGQEGVPAPGPGDFKNSWNTAIEAVEDILDFYFGDSLRMKAKEAAQNEVSEKINELLEEKEFEKNQK